MRFAIVGETSGTAAIVDVLHRSAGHSVTHGACLNDDSSLLASMPSLRRLAEWEDLLADDTIDAVIVSGDEELVLPPARQIAGTGLPLVVVPSPGMTSAFAYELSLVRDENLVPLYPILAHRLDPATVRMRELVHSGALGELIQIRLDREIPTVDNVALNQADVETWLLPDADLLRWIAGAFTQVTALYQGSTDTGFTNATVNLAGVSATDTSWVLTRSGSPKWTLTATGTLGKLVLVHDGTNSLSLNGKTVELAEGKTESEASDWVNSVPEAVTAFLEKTSPSEQSEAWTDFTRSHEIVDQHRRSIKRRRTIDMHFETLSERSQFKTQMSALGCGVLTYTLFGLVFYLLIAGVFAPREDAAQTVKDRFDLLCRIGQVLWLAPLTIFLAAQLLLAITKPPAKPGEEPNDGSE